MAPRSGQRIDDSWTSLSATTTGIPDQATWGVVFKKRCFGLGWAVDSYFLEATGGPERKKKREDGLLKVVSQAEEYGRERRGGQLVGRGCS